MATIKNIPFTPQGAYKPVVGNSKYIVTDSGFVYNLDYRGTGFTRPCCHVIAPVTGYVKVMLIDGKKKSLTSVHRIVAEAFIPNPENLSDVDHDDLNKQNNHVSNLAWKTHGQNLRDARTKLGNWSVKNNPNSIQAYTAYQFIDNVPNKGNFLKFKSLKAGAAHFQKPYHTFASVVAKAIKRQGYAYGYLWERS